MAISFVHCCSLGTCAECIRGLALAVVTALHDNQRPETAAGLARLARIFVDVEDDLLRSFLDASALAMALTGRDDLADAIQKALMGPASADLIH